MSYRSQRPSLLQLAVLSLSVTACAVDTTDPSVASDEEVVAHDEAALRSEVAPSKLTPFAFDSITSTSGEFPDGDVRLDAVKFGKHKLPGLFLSPIIHAKILVDDGVDALRGGHNLASGQGINSEDDHWARQGPATITPTGKDLAGSLGNLNLSSIVVTRENVGTASIEVTFDRPVNHLFFWERGSTASPTTANSDILVETLDWFGRVTASRKLLRSEYTPTGIEITTWNGSFASPSTPTGAYPQLGAAGLALDGLTQRLRLTSVQEAASGVRDDGPDYKVLGALVF